MPERLYSSGSRDPECQDSMQARKGYRFPLKKEKIDASMHAYIHTSIYIYVYIYIYIYMYRQMYVCLYTHIHALS